MVHHLAEYLRAAPDVVAVEQPFSVEVGRVVLRGVVDRLERVVGDDGTTRVRVVDLKTGRTAVGRGAAARHAQLGAYQEAVDSGAFDDVADGARSAGAALVYVGTDNRTYTRRDQPALATDDEPTWVGDLLVEVADVVSRSAVAASGNDLCRTCPVTRSCPLQPEGRVVCG
jgi:RecB family exonuclease